MKTKLILLTLLCSLVLATAGDISPGVTWSDDESAPESLVNSNRLTSFLSDATLRTNAIVDRTETTAAATNDFVLVFDASATALRKVALLHLVPDGVLGTSEMGSNSVTAGILASNVVQRFHFLTNWGDAVTANTNLVVNMPAGSDSGTNIFFLTFRSTSASSNNVPTNSVMAISPLSAVLNSAAFNTAAAAIVTNAVNTNRFVSGELDFFDSRATNLAHGLGVAPAFLRWVMVCKTNDAGYPAGVEVDVQSFEDGAGVATPQFSTWSDATNVGIASDAASVVVPHGTNATQNTAITEVRWRLKAYARP